MTIEIILAINIIAAALIVCWPARQWDARGLIEGEDRD